MGSSVGRELGPALGEEVGTGVGERDPVANTLRDADCRGIRNYAESSLDDTYCSKVLSRFRDSGRDFGTSRIPLSFEVLLTGNGSQTFTLCF